MQTNVLIKEECILKNKNKSCPYKKLSVFYNSCLKTFGSHLVYFLCTAVKPLNLASLDYVIKRLHLLHCSYEILP